MNIDEYGRAAGIAATDAAGSPPPWSAVRHARRTRYSITAITTAFVLTLGVVGAVALLRSPSPTTAPANGVAPVPAAAEPVAIDAFTDTQVRTLDLRASDRLYRLLLDDGLTLGVRVRDGQVPLLFGTSCDLLSSYPLPAGWDGLCLEYTARDGRVTGLFPYGTASVSETALVLLDGTRIIIEHPASLDITSNGVQAETYGALDGQARTIEAFRMPPADVVAQIEATDGPGQRTPLVAASNGDGGALELWRFERADTTTSYLIFDFSPWTVRIWATSAGGDAPLSESAQERWAHSLHGTVTDDGYLILSATDPLQLVSAADEVGPDGPDIRIDGASGGLGIYVDDCDRLDVLSDQTYDGPVFAWCDAETGTLLFAFGDSAFNQQAHETLGVESVTPPPPGPDAAFGRLDSDQPNEVLAAVDQARALWSGAGISSYRYTVAMGCFCPPNMHATVEVVDGQVASVTLLEPPGDEQDQFARDNLTRTIDDWLDLVATSVSDPPTVGRVQATFDPDLGIPLEVVADSAPGTYDTNFSFVITEFTPIGR